MKEIIVTNQKELDAIKTDDKVRIIIKGGERFNRIVVNKNYYYRVEAWENSSVVAWENSSVVARENSSVVAWGNSSVVARENSSVEAWENSSVVAWGNSSVVAWGNVGVHLYSDNATITLFFFAVCWKKAKGKIIKKSKTATIIEPKETETNKGWLEKEGVEIKDEKVILFKKVSKDFKTQENTHNETLWKVGTEVIHHDWKPTERECGEGKFHACSRPYFCDEFRDEVGDVYIAIEVNVKDLHAWFGGSYPHKIAFRACKVLYQVNKMGKKI